MDRASEARWTFDSVVEIYDAVRHGYPAALFDDLFSLLPERPRIVEVGPGTGQATRDLLARGATVHAIELGPSMAAHLSAAVAHADLEVTVGEFEKAVLPAHGADAVFAATAYHWIPPKVQLDRPIELLAAGGLIAIVDTVQVDSPADGGFFALAQPIYERHGAGHRGPPAPLRHEADPPIRRALAADDRYSDVRLRTYDWDQTYTTDEYRSAMLSYSSTQMLDESTRAALVDEIADLIDREFGGTVTRTLVIALTTATVG